MISSEEDARRFVAEVPGISSSSLERLDRFSDMLAAENERQNLVAKTTLAAVWQRHIADSAQLLRHVPRGTSTWLDLGTGSGFPGLIVAVLRPDLTVTMVESRSRRIEWLSRVCRELDVPNASIEGLRLQVVPTRTFSVISARAFAPLSELLLMSARFSTSATRWLLPKGRSAAQELTLLNGWQHTFHVEQSVTDPEAGILIGNLIGRKGKSS